MKPKKFEQNKQQALMPIDPDGGGSWLAVNNDGVLLCLLNLYEKQIPLIQEQVLEQAQKQAEGKKKLIQKSRGLLIKSLAFCQSQAELLDQLKTLDLKQYQAFRLLMISKSVKTQLVWDGTVLNQVDLPAFATSSSVDTKSVIHQRSHYFEEQPPQSIEQQLMLHRSHHPAPGKNSICMHRDDATTVSLSHLTIDDKTINYHYWDGSPCSSKVPYALVIPTREYFHTS